MIYDVIIVGAGPCGLAVAARLRERTPAALFTDAEHARYWRRFDKVRTLENEARQRNRRINCATNRTKSCSSAEVQNENIQEQPLSMLVLDSNSDEWLSSWRSRFEQLQIGHLRSPLFFHCDPRDRDGLLEYSHAEGRTDELEEITNVVGKEVSKHRKKSRRGKHAANQRAITRHLNLDNRDQIDYHTPSSTLFLDHCSCLMRRYRLEKIVQKATVVSLKYDTTSIPTESDRIFTLTTAENQLFIARTVVVAIGPGSSPSIPVDHAFLRAGSANHLFADGPLLPSHVIPKLSMNHEVTVAVIGGGLSSAQLAFLLVHHYHVTKVILILRSNLKTKHFDVDLDWVSKLRNANMAAFWSADSDQERFQMLKEARNGGSITPKWTKTLKQLSKEGMLEFFERSTVSMGKWDNSTKLWDLEIETLDKTSSSGRDPFERLRKEKHMLHGVDHVICATGMALDITKVDFLRDLYRKHDIGSISGLPLLNEDLMLKDGIPVFFTGGLAGLRLGPGAGNLAGARLGAERVAWGIESAISRLFRAPKTLIRAEAILGKRKHSEGDSGYGSGKGSDWEAGSDDDTLSIRSRQYASIDRDEFTGGFHNQFDALSI